jgi:hypothetical protein
MNKKKKLISKSILKNEITSLDLFILEKIHNGIGPTNISKSYEKEIEKEFGKKIGRNKIEKRISELKTKKIILKEKSIIVDPTKLFDYFFIFFIKMHLAHEITRGGTTWQEAINIIKERSEKYQNLIRILVVLQGMGEYDIMGLTYTNDMDLYYEFQHDLLTSGLIEKFDTKQVYSQPGLIFDPISIPNYRDFQ